MPSKLPEGDPPPADGVLPEASIAEASARPFGFYVHVPFCATRCGYCDFNTYTAKELGGGGAQASYAETAIGEIRFARRVLRGVERPVDTVFFGGGTPTLLAADDLGRMLGAIRDEFGLAAHAEVTTEANPESVDPRALSVLREAGFTRISFGMQSAAPHVLQVLDRQHTPGRALAAVAEAKAAGFEHINLDLIYGTPGESLDDWRASLESALSAEPDHLSAYALIVEDGTQLARRIRRGELPTPDDDDLADKYELADSLLSEAGFEWYEVSNWARASEEPPTPALASEGLSAIAAAPSDAMGALVVSSDASSARCRHNELYWRGDTWWGVGPGAHSHVGGVRWWNVKHPSAYAARLAQGESPAHAREVLEAETRRVERILLEIRLREGLPLDLLDEPGRKAALDAIDRGLLAEHGERLVLTRPGRLLADRVVRDLLP